MVREYGSKPHGSGVQDTLMAEVTETCMAMDYLYSLSNDYVAKDWKKGEDGR